MDEDQAQQLLDAAASAVWDIDDFEYDDYNRAIEYPFPLGKPYLENDLIRYQRMAAEAIVTTLETLAATDPASAERYRQMAEKVRTVRYGQR